MVAVVARKIMRKHKTMSKILKSIMLIEDERDIQEVTRLSLEIVGGYTVYICSSGREGVDKAPVVMPDLILLDVMMPVMDGLTTLKLLRENPKTNNIPVIFITAKAKSSEITNYIERGAIGVIRKPFDPMKLVVEINDIWNKQA